MAQGAISEEIHRHLEAVLTLSKVDLVRRLIKEAEFCIKSGQVSAAAILAEIVLEELSSLGRLSAVQKLELDFQGWREFRNREAHPVERLQEVDQKKLEAIVLQLQTILDEIYHPVVSSRSSVQPQNTFTDIKGKYAFVPTSVEDFLRRKREDLYLEA